MPNIHRLIPFVVVPAVIVVAIVGLVVSGSPKRARMIREDQNRLSDLQQIAYAMDAYFSSSGTLPNFIGETSYNYAVWPGVTKTFEYKRSTTSTYQLCDTFALATSGTYDGTMWEIPKRQYLDESWDHPNGYYCFSLKAHDYRTAP